MFLPDSLGYFAAASLLAGPAYAFGRPKAAAAACFLVALATFLVSNCTGAWPDFFKGVWQSLQYSLNGQHVINPYSWGLLNTFLHIFDKIHSCFWTPKGGRWGSLPLLRPCNWFTHSWLTCYPHPTFTRIPTPSSFFQRVHYTLQPWEAPQYFLRWNIWVNELLHIFRNCWIKP